MPAHTDLKHLNYTTVQLFDLVADVEKYPEFLPWVRAVRIVEREADAFIADVVVHFAHITEQYRCRVVVSSPLDASASGSIDVSLIKGPFHHLMNHWHFEPAPEGGCNLRFDVDFAFKTPLLDRIIGTLFDRATRKMVSAFEQRAMQLYVTC